MGQMQMSIGGKVMPMSGEGTETETETETEAAAVAVFDAWFLCFVFCFSAALLCLNE